MAFWKRKEKRAEQAVNESEGSKLLEAWLNPTTLTREQAMEISAVSSCVHLISDKVAAVPLRLYEKQEDTVVEIADDNRVKLLNGDTGDTLNATEMRREWIKDYFLGKGAYTYIERDIYGGIRSLRYVKPEHIAIYWNEDPIFKSYEITVNGQNYFPHDFLKICRNNDGHGRGKSITEENNLIFSVAYNTMKFENVLVKKGGNKKGFLQAKQKLSKDAMTELKRAWAQIYANGADNDNVIVLNDGVTFAESSNTSVEMQLNENKQTNMQQICSLFCTPYEIISGKATAEVQKLWIKNCIIPVLNVIEAALDSDMLLESEKNNRYWAFDTAELLRGDFQERMNAYATALQNNIMELDEVREREDLPKRGFNFMKLGLQDVLLDLKTNRIYTPNTNQFQDLGAVISDDKISAAGADERAFIQDPKTGKMMGSTSEKGVDKSVKSDIIKSSDDFEYISATGPNEFKRGFDAYNLADHWYGGNGMHSHKDEYPNMTMRQYADRALNLIQMPTSDNILGFKTKSGKVARYDIKENDFVIGSPKTGINTMFKPKRGIEYFYDKKKEAESEHET